MTPDHVRCYSHHPVVYCRVPRLLSTPGSQRSSPTHLEEPWPRGVYLDVITPIIVLPTPPIVQQTERAPFPPPDVYVTYLQTLRARAPSTQSTCARHIPLLSPMCVFMTPLSTHACVSRATLDSGEDRTLGYICVQ